MQSFNDLFLLLSGCYLVFSVTRWAPRICRLCQGRRWLYLESWSIELTSSGWWCRSGRWLRDCMSCTSSSPAAWRSISSVYTWAPTRTPLDVRGESVELPYPTLLSISSLTFGGEKFFALLEFSCCSLQTIWPYQWRPVHSILNRFPSFLFENSYCSMVVCTLNPDFGIMSSNGAHSPVLNKHYYFLKIENFGPKRGWVFKTVLAFVLPLSTSVVKMFTKSVQ